MDNFKTYDKDWDTKELPLRIDLMVTEYREARDKKAQIDILAEQCGTKTCRIAWILDRCGLAVDPKKLPRALRGENSFDYVAHWESSMDAVICDRIRERFRGLAEEAVEKLRETVEKEPEMVEMRMGGADTETVPAEEPKTGQNGDTDVPERPKIPGHRGDHGVNRIIAELWSIYVDKQHQKGVTVLGTVDVLKMQDLERIVKELVEGM